jgi:hypothetical protein
LSRSVAITRACTSISFWAQCDRIEEIYRLFTGHQAVVHGGGLSCQAKRFIEHPALGPSVALFTAGGPPSSASFLFPAMRRFPRLTSLPVPCLHRLAYCR